MTSVEFLTIFKDNILIAILSIIVSIIPFIYLLKNRVKSITDPLLLTIIFTIFANSVPILLYLTNNISNHIFSYFIISELIFWLTFYFYSPPPHTQLSPIFKQKINEKPLFYFCFTIYIIANLYYFKTNGLPIFNENRFEKTINDSTAILGFLLRLKSITSLFVHIYIIHLFKEKQFKTAIICFFICILISFMHGGKSFILGFVKAFFFYYLFYIYKTPKIKYYAIFIIAITPVITILVSNKTDGYVSAIIGYVYRLIASGDVYWNAYGNNIINTITIDNPLVNMTYFLWGPFRHILPISYDNDTMTTAGSIAFELASGFFPSGGAPNSRLSFLSYVYYKWNGLLLCFLLGWLSAKIYNKCLSKPTYSIGKTTIKGMLYTSIFLIPTDPYLFFNSIYSIIFFKILYSLYCSMLKPKSQCVKYQL